MNQTRTRHPAPAASPLSRDLILGVTGPIDDAKVAAIEASGGSLEELEAAAAWATGQSDVMGGLRLRASGRVALLHEILTADEDYGDERS